MAIVGRLSRLSRIRIERTIAMIMPGSGPRTRTLPSAIIAIAKLSRCNRAMRRRSPMRKNPRMALITIAPSTA